MVYVAEIERSSESKNNLLTSILVYPQFYHWIALVVSLRTGMGVNLM